MKEGNVRLNQDIAALKSKISALKETNELLKMELIDTQTLLEKYKLIADFAHDWEMWFDPDGHLKYVSPSFQNLSGYAAEELISQPGLLKQLIFPDDMDDYRTFIRDSINFVTIRQSLKFRILTRTKQIRWCEIKCRAVYNKRGKYLGQRASVNDITRLMQALGEIKSLTDGRDYEALVKQKYIRELESKDRELVSYLMSLSQKNETLQYIRRVIEKQLAECVPSDVAKFTDIIQKIDGTLFSSESWNGFTLHFEKVHPGFFERLSIAFPGLTSKDKKLCAYLRLQLATKEIATLLNITPQSAEISRVRLRKKLGLTRAVNLVEYLLKV
ncbi:MAG TPA: PAS domain-containing protein [Bacteroidales bacterium]|nr:PAS domain-containing protein [Bacteroidales bacterium]